MMKRGEFAEEEASSLSRSPSSPLQNSWYHSPNSHFHHNIFTGDSSLSSSRFCLGSPSDHWLSSYFSNGFGLCESMHRLNIKEEDEEEKTHHQHFTGKQLSGLRNYEPSNDGGASSVFSVDKSSLSPYQNWSNAYNQVQSYGETLCPEVSCHARSMVSSPSKSMMEPFIFDNSLIMEAENTFKNHYVPSYSPRKSFVGRMFEQHLGSSSNTNHPSLPDFQGYVYMMAKDQHGCRLLQKIIEDGNALDAMVIFNEVMPHVVELMMDPFGNYLMQKLLDVCNEEQRTQILLIVTAEPGRLIRISLNAYGTRVVQRLVESIKTKRQIFLVKSALRPGFLNLVRDLNGNHVIQRCLQCLSTEDNEFIFEDATRFCIDIATHRHGCCVLQKCVAYSSGQRREKLITEISRNSLFLAQDPYGNYAVQFIIELRDVAATAMVLSHLKGHYLELSMQKFSSHTVERCLTHCPESRPQMVLELISVPRFDLLIQDPYANFVIQAALSVTKGSLHAMLVEVLRPHSNLRKNPYCKRIFSKDLLRN